MTPSTDDCLFCRKSAGLEAEPIGGFILDDGRWLLNHAHPSVGEAGTLVLSSRRHFLDFADMTSEEATSLHELLQKLYPAVKSATGAARVYFIAMMANQPHFHVWLVPQQADAERKAFDLLTAERTATREAVEAAAESIRTALA